MNENEHFSLEKNEIIKTGQQIGQNTFRTLNGTE